MPSPLVVYDLENVTDYLGFESFCNDLMSREGFPGITPLGGSSDRGRDAIHRDAVTNTIFAYSVRHDWRTKLAQDLESIARHAHACDRVVFVTNATLSANEYDTQRDVTKARYGWDLDIFDIKRIATLINNAHRDLIDVHPSIFKLSSVVTEPTGEPFSPSSYCARLLNDHARSPNEYALLMAEHHEIDAFVETKTRQGVLRRLPVVDVPNRSRVSFLLGESGAGKSTSLWQLTAKYSERVLAGQNSHTPVLLNLRNWTRETNCEGLLEDQFSMRGFDGAGIDAALKRGSFLILIDGLNEVTRARQSDCYYDLKAFLHRSSSNRIVIACRSVDFKTPSDALMQDEPRIAHDVYEIARMDREQIKSYARDYLTRESLPANEFFEALRIDEDAVWENTSSVVHLIRIPLFLQVFLEAFRSSGELPNSRADLLQILVRYVVRREIARGSPFDEFVYRRTLGQMAVRASDEGFGLRFPGGLGLSWLSSMLAEWRTEGIVNADVLVADVWRRVLSANFLYEDRYSEVSWLHQLIRDFFQGAEFARIWLLGSPHRDGLTERIATIGLETALAVTLSLLPIRPGAELLRTLIYFADENGRRAFEGQSTEVRRQLVEELVSPVIADGDPETNDLMRLARALPYVETAETLDASFYDAPDDLTQAKVTEALAEFMIEHQPRVQQNDMLWYDEREAVRLEITARAVKRCAELLRRRLRSPNELASFYAAKGLFETDRSAAVDRLRELSGSDKSAVRSLVRDLVDEWGLE